MSKPTKTRSLCSGCRNDFYNGKNPLGVKECWSFTDAKVVKRLGVGVWENPPYRTKNDQWVMSCFSQKGTVFIDAPKVLTSEGFWK
jgi:hypothetical protein